jgi:hypothetical protein
LFHFLRKYRRLFSIAVLATLVVWLSAVLVGCLLPSTQSMSASVAVTMVDMQPHANMAGTTPCPQGICAVMESDRELVADHEIVPTTSKLILAAPFLAVALFTVANPQRDGPRPPDPLLPGRSPTLRFYALRI